MPDEQPSHPATDAVKALARFLHEPSVDALTPVQIDAALKHAGINSDRVMSRFLATMEGAEGRAELQAAARKRQSWSQRFVEFSASLPKILNPREKLRALLEIEFAGKPEYAVAFRKFEETTEDDLSGLLVELEFLGQSNDGLGKQIEELAALNDGWLDGKGVAPDKEGIAWGADLFSKSFPESLPLPLVAPTPEGGLFLEWITDCYRVSGEILLPRHVCELQATNVDSGETLNETVNLDEPHGLEEFYAFVRRFV